MSDVSAAEAERMLTRLEARYGLRPPESPRVRRAVSQVLAARPGDLDAFLPLIANHHTWFLRDRPQLEALVRALPATARVWSAGCASGEEPYSLAMLAALAGRPSLHVLATDVVPSVLARARAARYAGLALRHVEERLRERFFHEVDGDFVVRDAIREQVRFARHNLCDDPVAPGSWDAIVCRNVLIHFHPDAARRVIVRLGAALAPGGVLVLGAADALLRPRTKPPAASPASPPESPSLAHRAPPSAPPPPSALVHLDAGNRLAVARDQEGALACYAEAFADPSARLAAEARLLAGVALRRRGDLEVAVGALREATFLDADLWQAWWALAGLHDALGLTARAGAAIDAARAALERPPPRRLASNVTGLAGLDLDPDRARVLLARRAFPEPGDKSWTPPIPT